MNTKVILSRASCVKAKGSTVVKEKEEMFQGRESNFSFDY
jgi:hypothetical protein